MSGIIFERAIETLGIGAKKKCVILHMDVKSRRVEPRRVNKPGSMVGTLSFFL